jgi:multidrug resistance efflux pump
MRPDIFRQRYYGTELKDMDPKETIIMGAEAKLKEAEAKLKEAQAKLAESEAKLKECQLSLKGQGK